PLQPLAAREADARAHDVPRERDPGDRLVLARRQRDHGHRPRDAALRPPMSLRRLEVLQWIGLLAGALVWTGRHVVGYGITEAECSRGGMHWGITNDVWQGVLLGAAALLVLAAEAAAVAVVYRTRESSYESPP